MNFVHESTLESALADCGWEHEAPARWRLPSTAGDCELVEIAHRDCWRQFQLSGGRAPQSSNTRLLADNFRVFGPAKLVARSGGHPICRLDVPDALTDSGAHSFDPNGQLQILDANAAWAAAVTVCATGNCDAKQADSDLATLANDLKQAGWSASLADDQLQIHLQLPGIYRQLTIENSAKVGVKLATDLAPLARLDNECVRAMAHLASEVNARVPLVRLAISGSSPEHALRAEVGFGIAMIPGAFLLRSLHAFETTIALCARELEALRDRDLARLVLAAAGVNELDVCVSN